MAAHAWVSCGLVGDPSLGVDPRVVMRDLVLGHLGVAAAAARTVAADLPVDQITTIGLPVAVLQAESNRAELLVLGDRGVGGFTGLLVGSVGVALSAYAACPVVVVRGPVPDRPAPRTEPVVVGVDGTAASESAVGFAFDAAARRGVPLVAVHAWQDVLVDSTMAPLIDWEAVEADEREVLAERLAGWSGKYPDVEVRRRVVRDRPHTPWWRNRGARSWWWWGRGAAVVSRVCCWGR